MKLFIVVPAFYKGGVERVVSTLSQEWVKGNEVKVIFFDGSHLAYPLNGDIIDLKLLARDGIFHKIVQLIRRSIQLAKLFRREKPDFIFSFMESANFPSIFAAYFTGKLKQLKVSVHADPENMSKFQRLLISYLYRYPQQIVAVSKGVTYALIKIGVPKKKIKIIYNPLATSIPPISIPLPSPINAPKNYILSVGNFFKYKGFDQLIEAFSNISDTNIHLVILGEGEERNKLENIIFDKGLSDRIHLLGLVDDIYPWYRHAKCFVSSSLTESWGNAMLEAMSQNCPVVAFDCDYGPREIITHDLNGLLVTINDVKSLTDTINILLFDNHLYSKLSDNALIRASDFNAKVLSAQWLKDS